MEKKRILFIDDESGFTRLVKLTLERTKKYEVLEENDGRRSLATAKEYRPDMIFIDVVMPDVDGGDVAAQLRREPILRNVPIVFLTAIVSEKESIPGGLIGGFPFLSKPVSADKLMECIEENVKNSAPATPL